MYIYDEAAPRISFIFQTLVPTWSPWPFLTPSITSKIPCILFNGCSRPLSVLVNPGSHLKDKLSSLVRLVQWAQGEAGHPPGSALLPDRCSFSSSDAHASRPIAPNSPCPSYLCYSSCHEDF
ncbi:unnamed protein product [Rangifer tarandus platyrhynchus]|uniref:Uncharacterized protein n=2 Tax=Rangifer tarandus platyrhynchus TaxID=3082113 RepID=A0ABN8XQN5_RANTA|nr:unnamed protein product [Rangifer tarandus platyrhynchus]